MAVRERIGRVDDLGQQRQEDRAQQLRCLGVTDQVERRVGGEQALGRDLAAVGRAGDAREPVGAQQCLRRRLYRAAGPVGLRLERAHGLIGGARIELVLFGRGAGEQTVQRGVECTCALPVRPRHDLLDAAARLCRRVQQRCQPLLGGDRPEVPTLDAALIQLTGRRQPPGDLERSIPGCGSAQRRPGVAHDTGELEGVEHEHLPELTTAGECRAEQVGLDRGGDRRTLPFEQRRDRQARRLPRLWRSECDQRVLMFGAQQASTVVSEGQPARWPACPAEPPDQDRQLAPRRPARAGVITTLP